ncbi:MAG: malate:quinone oxidoreductase, partial [Campylobacter concisus]
ISTGEGIRFNMTPSPGATSCFEIARTDMIEACKFLGKNFNEEKFNAEFFE